MATTKYTVETKVAGGFAATDFTRTNKASAVSEAERLRKETGKGARVVTGAGTVVFEIKGKRVQAKTIPYTREVDVPEGFDVPKGFTAAYARVRKDAIVLRPDNTEEPYKVVKISTGKDLAEVENLREAAGVMTSLK